MTNELQIQEEVIQENNDFIIYKEADGTFRKEMKYDKVWTSIPETEEDQIKMYQVLNSDSSSKLVTPLKNMIDDTITIQNTYTNPYQSFDEKTGKTTNGVTTIIEDTDGTFYATSSKAVYYTLSNLYQSFGMPNSEHYKPIIVTVTGTKMANGVQINLMLQGLEK